MWLKEAHAAWLASGRPRMDIRSFKEAHVADNAFVGRVKAQVQWLAWRSEL